MTILAPNTLNPNALVAPGVYISPQQPAPPLTGAESDVILIVGSGTFGPVNAPIDVIGLQNAISTFGTPQQSTYDLVSQVMAASSVGTNQFVCVRVTDGNDTASKAEIEDNQVTAVVGLTLTCKYTGSLGNAINIQVSQGTNYTVAAPVYRISIMFPTGGVNNLPEVFDNIGGTGNAFWVNAAAAINNGQGALAAASQLVTAAAGTSVSPPAIDNYTMTGGTDGNSTLTDADLVGSTVLPRSGMYAADGADFSLMLLANVTDETTYNDQIIFAQSQGAYAILTRPKSESYTAGITAKKNAALNVLTAEWGKLMVGDWVLMQDNYNNLSRYISPQPWIAGVLSGLPPQNSSLNKILSSNIFLGTETSINGLKYSASDIATILQNGLDVIALPSPGGFYYSAQTGKNLGGNLLANGDEYTRNTNFIAETLNQQLGVYIGQLDSPSEVQSVLAYMDQFLDGLWKTGAIGSSENPTRRPYIISIDNSQIRKGIQIANIEIAFLRVVVVFLVNLKTGLVSIGSVTNQ